jgi:hypothetical protein
MERIICAAIYYDNGEEAHVHMPVNIATGIVVCGLRHAHCFPILRMIYPDRRYLNKKLQVQGFITSKHRFVNREDALAIAIDAGQITEPTHMKGRLDSSDLY